jgi:hypothetical protein
MSQFSDAFSSSVYRGPFLDYFEYVSNDIPLQLQSLSPGRQPTLTPISESPQAPNYLTCICPDKIRIFILYTPKIKQEYVVWWILTTYGSKKKIQWDAKRDADCWKNYDQVAHEKDEKPGIMCYNYRKVLDHPRWANHGTSSMNKHYMKFNCQKAAKNTGKKLNIKLTMEHAVYFLPFKPRIC